MILGAKIRIYYDLKQTLFMFFYFCYQQFLLILE